MCSVLAILCRVCRVVVIKHGRLPTVKERTIKEGPRHQASYQKQLISCPEPKQNIRRPTQAMSYARSALWMQGYLLDTVSMTSAQLHSPYTYQQYLGMHSCFLTRFNSLLRLSHCFLSAVMLYTPGWVTRLCKGACGRCTL